MALSEMTHTQWDDIVALILALVLAPACEGAGQRQSPVAARRVYVLALAHCYRLEDCERLKDPNSSCSPA